MDVKDVGAILQLGTDPAKSVGYPLGNHIIFHTPIIVLKQGLNDLPRTVKIDKTSDPDHVVFSFEVGLEPKISVKFLASELVVLQKLIEVFISRENT